MYYFLKKKRRRDGRAFGAWRKAETLSLLSLAQGFPVCLCVCWFTRMAELGSRLKTLTVMQSVEHLEELYAMYNRNTSPYETNTDGKAHSFLTHLTNSNRTSASLCCAEMGCTRWPGHESVVSRIIVTFHYCLLTEIIFNRHTDFSQCVSLIKAQTLCFRGITVILKARHCD